VTRRWHLLGLDGDSAGALGRGGELVGERLQHGTVGDAVVELLQARLHLRHFGRQEPERRRSVVRWPPHQLLSTAVLCSSSGQVRWVDWMGSTQGEAGGRRLPVTGDWRCLNDLAPDWDVLPHAWPWPGWWGPYRFLYVTLKNKNQASQTGVGRITVSPKTAENQENRPTFDSKLKFQILWTKQVIRLVFG
jgi:hypothetical protein